MRRGWAPRFEVGKRQFRAGCQGTVGFRVAEEWAPTPFEGRKKWMRGHSRGQCGGCCGAGAWHLRRVLRGQLAGAVTELLPGSTMQPEALSTAPSPGAVKCREKPSVSVQEP